MLVCCVKNRIHLRYHLLWLFVFVCLLALAPRPVRPSNTERQQATKQQKTIVKGGKRKGAGEIKGRKEQRGTPVVQ